MLLSTFSHILKREIVHVESDTEHTIIPVETVVYEMERIRDNIYEAWKRSQNLIEEKRVYVRKANDYLLPSIQPTNKGRLVVNIFGEYLQRELILLGLITYNIWHEYITSSVKDIMVIKLAIPVLSSLIAKTNVSRRPVAEELLSLEATIWLTFHYLSLYEGVLPQYLKPIAVEKILAQYYKMDWTMKQKLTEITKSIVEEKLSRYDSSIFLDLLSKHLLSNSRDVVINMLSRRVNNNIIYALDEPLYAIIEIINSVYLKVHTLAKDIKDDVVSRILLMFKKSLRS